jgi:hypothetical protein
MKLRDFLKEFVEPNTTIKLWRKIPGGHQLIQQIKFSSNIEIILDNSAKNLEELKSKLTVLSNIKKNDAFMIEKEEGGESKIYVFNGTGFINASVLGEVKENNFKCMDHEILKEKVWQSRYLDTEVVGVTDIVPAETHDYSVNIVLKL